MSEQEHDRTHRQLELLNERLEELLARGPWPAEGVKAVEHARMHIDFHARRAEQLCWQARSNTQRILNGADNAAGSSQQPHKSGKGRKHVKSSKGAKA